MPENARNTTLRKKPVNSCRKGKSAEREFAQALTALGHPATRGQQHKGGGDSPDVVCSSLPRIHFEVKFYATCQMNSPAMLAQWRAQAEADAGTKLPVIAHRWNGSRRWWVWSIPHGVRGYWQPLEDWISDIATVRP